MHSRWTIIAGCAFAVAGCREPRANAEEPASAGNVPVAATEAVGNGANRAARPKGPDKIYYDLMRYEWYAQGRPLIHAGQSYQPDGMPVAIELADLNRAGEYEGVDYYILKAADPDGLIYVPVFEGYWLPFGPAAPIGLPTND